MPNLKKHPHSDGSLFFFTPAKTFFFFGHVIVASTFCFSLAVLVSSSKSGLSTRIKQTHCGLCMCVSLSQLIAELQTSMCDSKEEAVRLQQAMEKRLRETSDRWDEERRRMSADADQVTKVSVERGSQQKRARASAAMSRPW